MTPSSSPILFPRHTVTAVLVAHDGIRWVHRSLDGLTAQTRAPDRIVAVDTASTDGTHEALLDVLGEGRVVSAPADTGFGAAIAMGLDSATSAGPTADRVAEVGWVWLLHDDAEADPEALRRLLEVVDRSPSIGIAGPKVRGWYDRRRLVEVGVTVGRSGRRETGLERHEHDQGQHDGVREVLAVGSAGMLVRRDVWHALGGLDPWLPLLRDDVDLGWRANLAGHRVVCVTDAVIHHAEAAGRGRRPLAATVNRRHLVDRRHALYVVLANLPLLGLPLAFVRMLLGSLLRALLLALGKLPGEAVDELAALAAVLGRPDRLVRARMARRATRRLPARAVSRLLAPTGLHLRHGIETVASALTRGEPLTGRGRHVVAEPGPVADEAESLGLGGGGTGVLRRTLLRPITVLVGALVLLALIADRRLGGPGALSGGALLPATGSAGGLWSSYLSGWHPVGLGTATIAPPYLAVLGSLAAPLGGSVAAAVGVLMLWAVPLCGLSAYLASRRLVASRGLRAWGALAYATLPAITGAVASGRVGLVLGAVLLPPTLLAAAHVLDWPEWPGSWRAAGMAAVLLTLLTACVPLAWLLALALAGLGALAVAGTGALQPVTGLRLGTVLAVPAATLAPWWPQLVREPHRFWVEPGLPAGQLTDPGISPVSIALLHPGGSGMYPVLVSVPLVLAALAALLRRTHRIPVLAGWAVALVGVAAGLLAQRVLVPAADGGHGQAWPGPGTLLAGAGLLVAALVGADGASTRMRSSSFGLRQPVALLLAAAAALVPVLAGIWWAAGGADGDLQRGSADVLPAFVAAEASQPDRPRTLLLRARRAGLDVSVVADHGPRLGDGDVAPDGALDPALLAAVGTLVAGRDDAVDGLEPYALRYVVLLPPVDRAVASRLDGQPGLARISAEDGTFLWKSDRSVARVRAVPEGAGAPPTVVAAGPVSAAGAVPGDSTPGRLGLADRADDGWRATLDGRPLSSAPDHGLQGFALPSGGGAVRVWHQPSAPTWLRVAQLALLALAAVLALPAGRREDDEDVPEDEEAELAAARGRRRRDPAEVTT